MLNSGSTSRQSTISNVDMGSNKATSTKRGACTHITMTRLWTTEFQCPTCLQQGSFGWLYRCTQDRELLIENDMDFGREVSCNTWCYHGVLQYCCTKEINRRILIMSAIAFLSQILQRREVLLLELIGWVSSMRSAMNSGRRTPQNNSVSYYSKGST